MNEYKYKFTDCSIACKYLSKYIFNPLSIYIPQRITPNMITYTGFFLTIISAFFVFLAVNGHRWAFLLASVSVFLYMACDNLDGIHARRTGQTSQLGEFLDHWLDTFNTTFLTLAIFIVFKLDGILLLITVFFVFIAFLTTSWDYSHNNIFYTASVGATEVLIFIIISFICQFFLYDTKILFYEENHFTVIFLFAIISILANTHITLRCILRTYKYIYELILPIILALIIFLYAMTKQLSFMWAAALILSLNSLLSGGYFLSVLVGKNYNKRFIGLIIFIIFGIIFLFFNFSKDFYKNFFIVSSIFLSINIFWDFFIALRYLPGPNGKVINKKTVSNGIY